MPLTLGSKLGLTILGLTRLSCELASSLGFILLDFANRLDLRAYPA